MEQETAQAKEVRAGMFADLVRGQGRRQRRARCRARRRKKQNAATEQALIAAQDESTRAARAAAERASALATLEAEIRRLEQSVRSGARMPVRSALAALEELGDGVALTRTGGRGAHRRRRCAHRQRRSARRAGKPQARRRKPRASGLRAIGEDAARWEARRNAAASQIAELSRRQRRIGGRTRRGRARAGGNGRQAQRAAGRHRQGRRRQAPGVRRARRQPKPCWRKPTRQAKSADQALSAAREERARAQALSESAATRIEELRTRIRDELECAPEELSERAEIRDGEELPPLEQAEKRVEKLKQEREQLGGVNLRAEEEADEQEARLTTLVADRDDLVGAIDRLRRGIQSLNREGRERLLESFEKVNRNFQELFTKLFEGGEAKLTFTESEDPLEAGLEIFARPPGKRLQSLALLSGGEQALTAMALIFAVFLVNPAPVCVLDEVDAPLDDANVERFCNMLTQMTEMSGTRFLVITHHALTMSRMDRLFGVTMAERGVSQLVSVTLAEAEKVAAE